MASQEICEQVLVQYEDELGQLPNVVGLGIVDSNQSSSFENLQIAVYVEKKVPLSTLKETDIIPKVLTWAVDRKRYRIPVTIIVQGELQFE